MSGNMGYFIVYGFAHLGADKTAFKPTCRQSLSSVRKNRRPNARDGQILNSDIQYLPHRCPSDKLLLSRYRRRSPRASLASQAARFALKYVECTFEKRSTNTGLTPRAQGES